MNSVDLEGAARQPAARQDNVDQLSGHMGVLQLAFTVMAYNAPIVGFVGYMPVVILLGNGVGTPVALLACGVIVSLLASGILFLARRMDSQVASTPSSRRGSARKSAWARGSRL